MSLSTQINRSVSALPLLLVALMAILQAPAPGAVPRENSHVATRQLLLPLLAPAGLCPVPRATAAQQAVVAQVRITEREIVLSRCRV